MTATLPTAAADAFERHDGFDRTDDGFALTTTTFETRVGAGELGDSRIAYTVTVTVPSIQTATADEVGETVAADWLRTLRLRLEDAPMTTRAPVELEEFDVGLEDGTVRVEYVFEWDDPAGAADIAKAFAEFVEGTYVEGIVPGYEYEPPVANLLARASQGGQSGTPL